MATRRKSTKGKAGHEAPARRRGGRAGGARSRGRRSGARQARPAQASRELRHDEERSPAEPPGRLPEGPPSLRLAEPPVVEEGTRRSAAGARDPEAEARDREAAELARRIEAAVGGASDSLRTGPDSAAEQLRAHREQMEEVARWREGARELPGVAQLGIELTVGALRLARSMATAPLRLGFAILRRTFVRA